MLDCQETYPKLWDFWNRFKELIEKVGYTWDVSTPHIRLQFPRKGDLALTLDGRFFIVVFENHGTKLGFRAFPINVRDAVRLYGPEEILITAMKDWLKARIEDRFQKLPKEESFLHEKLSELA